MRTHQEVKAELLSRKAAYDATKRRRIRVAVSVGSAAACLAVVLAVGIPAPSHRNENLPKDELSGESVVTRPSETPKTVGDPEARYEDITEDPATEEMITLPPEDGEPAATQATATHATHAATRGIRADEALPTAVTVSDRTVGDRTVTDPEKAAAAWQFCRSAAGIGDNGGADTVAVRFSFDDGTVVLALPEENYQALLDILQ